MFGEVLPVGDPLADEQGGDEPDQPDVQPVPEPETPRPSASSHDRAFHHLGSGMSANTVVGLGFCN
jgi:hypothetical protein